tara:strand:+ start:6606 stop:6977 length:372 start_codon:yes stop_codon:yes gene_type:complete
MGGISNFVNLNNLGVINTRSRYQRQLADLIVERVRLQSDISRLNKIHRELTNMWRSIKVNKTNFDKLTIQQRTKRYNNATKTINDLENQRNKVSQLIDNHNKKIKKIKRKIENVKENIRYYST